MTAVLMDSRRLVAFSRLDEVLAHAVAAVEAEQAEDEATDTFPGLHMSAVHARRLLRTPLGSPRLALARPCPPQPSWDRITSDHAGWSWLRTRHGLSDLELDLVLMALAPEADLRYERLYGFLQDDLNRRRPLVGLALDLLTSTVDERLAGRGAFGSGAPLTEHRILTLVPDHRAVEPPLLAHAMVLDEQIVDVLLDQQGLDRRLAPCCRLEVPAPPAGAARVVRPDDAGHGPVRLYAQGPAGAERNRPARDLAAAHGAPLLTVETARLPDDSERAATLLALAFREASLLGAVLTIADLEGLDRLTGEYFVRGRTLEDLLAGHEGDVVITGARDWAPEGRHALGVLPIPVVRCGFTDRRALWEQALAAQGVTTDPADLHDLAARFRLGPDRIADAALTAVAAARRRAAAEGLPGPPSRPTRAELFASARGQNGHALDELAHHIEPVYGRDDIMLPPDTAAQLDELRDRVAHRHRVMDEWGFADGLPRSTGIGALFSGPSGTGKTMAAEVIAHELELDLFRIDLSTVVSKYVGETEKNLERIFTAAADSDAVLLFDEADALFGKRSEVRDAHDRYANLEISYLLQRMERYEGLAILTTNLRRNIDEAFTRRLQFIVEFPFPGAADRERIWRVCFPEAAPCAADVDVGRLARDYPLPGGSIRNVVLHAAFLAAAEDSVIGMPHLVQAIRREFQKTDRVMPEGAGPGHQHVRDRS
ncbi:ATP-binding protein [Streptomyces griseoluteus]|uniref:ATP-binding protein n=1 Tax=Streptomyces griseoluteus TaxID=29306 RepID=A0A4Z1DPG2_STRGP|nr:ATP-binding protein [Streptomyces griseoluteus]TGN84646.1 ATP-binding protein [Streptomyces griseoluteus]GHF00246.1 ATPase AAA [Streptomyces griseoluteus]